MIQSVVDIGTFIRQCRKQHHITQRDLALTAGTGVRFIIELEKGKSSCELGKVLQVLQVLGIQCHLKLAENNNEK